MTAHLTTKELAARLRVRVDTINHWRVAGNGPRWLKLGAGRGSRVVYRVEDVEAWERTAQGGVCDT